MTMAYCSTYNVHIWDNMAFFQNWVKTWVLNIKQVIDKVQVENLLVGSG